MIKRERADFALMPYSTTYAVASSRECDDYRPKKVKGMLAKQVVSDKDKKVSSFHLVAECNPLGPKVKTNSF